MPAMPLHMNHVAHELHFVQAAEIGELGRVTRLAQGVERRGDQMREPPAEDGLLREQIRLRFLGETGFDDARAAMPHGRTVGQAQTEGRAGGIRVDGEQRRRPGPLDVGVADLVADPQGRDHEHVEIGPGRDQAEVDVVTVGEQEPGAGASRLSRHSE